MAKADWNVHIMIDEKTWLRRLRGFCKNNGKKIYSENNWSDNLTSHLEHWNSYRNMERFQRSLLFEIGYLGHSEAPLSFSTTFLKKGLDAAIKQAMTRAKKSETLNLPNPAKLLKLRLNATKISLAKTIGRWLAK